MIPQELHDLYTIHCQARLAQYRAAMAQANIESLVIDGGGLRYRFLDDTSYPFRLNPYLARLAPLQGFSESMIVISAKQALPELLIYQPQDYWHAVARLECAAVHQSFTVKVFTDVSALRSAAAGGTDSATAYLGERPSLLPQTQANPALLVAYLDYQQAVKTEYEIECILRANELAANGHRAVAQACQHSTSELRLHADYLQAIDSSEDSLPYDNIIATNNNAATLHYTLRDNTVQPLNSLLIDAGATYLGYCSDISRTYSNRDGLFNELISQLNSIQLAVCEAIKPGLQYTDLHHQVTLAISDLLVDNGIITCSKEQAHELQLAGIFFPHGLGHLLGVQVHDRGGHQADITGRPNPPPEQYPHLRFTRALETNQVFTIEPGLYFIDQLLQTARGDGRGKHLNWNLIDELKPFGGIRIEDNLRVTEQGHVNLTRQWL